MEIQVASCFLKGTFPADFATGSHVVEMTKMSRCVKSVEIPGVNDTFSAVSSLRETQSFFMAQLKPFLPQNSSLAEKVCLGWRCTQRVPYCYTWTERPLTQRDSNFYDQHCYDLCGASLKKLNKEKVEEDNRSSCLGILEDMVLWGTNLSN